VSEWGIRAGSLMEQALDEIRTNTDAIPTLEAALVALRIEVGELSSEELDGYPFPGEDRKGCLAHELLKRGGFRGGCPVHSSPHRQ
jgi:hypothetical protein